MGTKITKREETTGITFGNKIVKLADICKVSQIDGSANGFTVGLLIGKKDKNGDLARRTFAPLAEVLKYELGPMMLTPFNEFTKVWKDERKAAEAVKTFTERYNGLELGARAAAILATEEEVKTHTQSKKSDVERMSAFLAKFTCRKNLPLNGSEFVTAVFSALEKLPLHKSAKEELSEAWAAIANRRSPSKRRSRRNKAK